MAMPFAREFTNELSSQYLAGLMNEVELGEAAAESRARTEGSAGGLEGLAVMGSEIGAARQGAISEKTGLINAFNMDVANKSYSERMTDEARSFQADQAQKNREFQEQMAQLGYQERRGELSAERGFERVQSQQGLVAGGLIGLATGGAGSGLGARAGAKAGGTVGNNLPW